MSTERASAEPAAERPAPAPAESSAASPLATRLLELQRTAGNRVARRVLQRDQAAIEAAWKAATASAAGAAANNTAVAAADWAQVVPDADALATATSSYASGKQTVVYGTKPKPKPKKGTVAPPDPVPAPIDASTQKSIDDACKAVADYRASLAEPAATGGVVSSQGAKWTGTWWTRYTAMGKPFKPPTATKKDPNPVDPRTDAQKAAYESASTYDAWLRGLSKTTGSRALPAAGEDPAPYRSWLGDRLFLDIAGLEGGTDSINVYDKQIITWGGGLGGASGAVPGAMKLVADSTASGGGKTVGTEVTRVLHAAGIAFDTTGGGAKFVVCDPGSKRKYRGDNALHLIKADNRLLMLFTSISRGELPGVDVSSAPAGGQSLKDATRRAVFDAQKDYFLNKYNTGDFGAAVKQLGGTWPYDSIMMVLHLEWWGVSRWSQYKDTGGDMKKIIQKAISLYTSYTELRNGAHVAKRDLASHLQNFGGATSEACWGPEEQLAPDKLENDAYYVETKPAVAHQAAVPAVTDAKGKVIKKGKAEVAAADARYRKLKP